MFAGLFGGIGPLAASFGPLSAKRTGESERLAMVNVTNPAPKRSGETITWPEPTFAVTSIGAAGRGSFAKSLDPQAASDSAAAMASAAQSAPRARRGALPAPLVLIDATLAQGPFQGRRSSKRKFHHLGADSALAHLDERPRLGLAADHGERDRPVGGGDDGRPDPPDLTALARNRVVRCDRRLELQPAQAAVGPSLVVQARDRLLTDVAALREADRPPVDPGFLGDRGGAHLVTEAGATGFNTQDLRRRLGNRRRAGLDQRSRDVLRPARRADEVDAELGGNGPAVDAAHLGLAVGVLGGERSRPGELAGRGAEQGQDGHLVAGLGDLDLATDLVDRQVAHDRVRRSRLRVDPHLIFVEAQHPHVRLHVAL